MTDLLTATNMANAPAVVLATQLNLRGAWERVHGKDGMAGADGVTIGRFARSADGALADLESDLAGGRYRPLPLRMAQLEKKSGGSLRLLMVPSVVDRIAQSAAAQWLGMKWNASFDRASYAYRPGMGTKDALRRLHALRESGYRWVLDADLRSFFDSIDHDLLVKKLAVCLGPTSPLLTWIEPWIRTTVWDGAELLSVQRGVPQGSPLSPILSNFYLHELDARLRSAKIEFIRYADDFLTVARTPFDLAEARKVVEAALADLHLTLNENKTRTVTFDQSFRFVGAEMQGDSILLPFEKKKTPLRPVYVAPVMPFSLLRAFQAGHLKASRPFVWAIDAAEPHSAKNGKTASAVELARVALAGNQRTSSLKLLSGRGV